VASIKGEGGSRLIGISLLEGAGKGVIFSVKLLHVEALKLRISLGWQGGGLALTAENAGERGR
jgi:hypothetical protein